MVRGEGGREGGRQGGELEDVNAKMARGEGRHGEGRRRGDWSQYKDVERRQGGEKDGRVEGEEREKLEKGPKRTRRRVERGEGRGSWRPKIFFRLYSLMKQLLPNQEIIEDYLHPMLFWGKKNSGNSIFLIWILRCLWRKEDAT
jgi:hypothetical protein